MAENERPNPVIIHDTENGKDYTLEFDRDAIKFAESRKFRIEDVDDYPMTKVPEFFWYAFRMHHPSVSLAQAEKLLDRLGGMNEALSVRLGELWVVPYKAMAPKEEEERKNLGVTVDL